MYAHELKNVVVPDDVQKNMRDRSTSSESYSWRCHPIMEPVIAKLAIDKPTWRFHVSVMMRSEVTNEEAKFLAYGFNVFEDGEALGSIERIHARFGYKIQVRNERIMNARQRGSGYATENPDKAIAKVKKTFGRLSQKEMLEKAQDKADSFTSDAHMRHRHQIDSAERNIKNIAIQYVMTTGFANFMNYVENEMPAHEREQVHKAADKKAELEAEMATLLSVRDRLGSNSSALVVRDLEKYIVRVGDTVNLYDDNTLPADMRGKIGMLKLVEREHFVSDIGCRVDDNIFVILLDEGNNVSEGETNEV